jgi:DNA-binding MarR family transcriptional regulator
MATTGDRTRRKSARADRRAALESDALLAARALVDRMRALYRELERLTDAPITLHRALVCIGNQPGLPASELARQLGMKKPAVSQVLKSLATRGWIERRRHEGDQRSVHIHTTAAGEKILRATAGRAVVTLQRAVRHLSSGDLTRLARGLESLLSQLPEPSTSTVVIKRRPTSR